MKMLLFDVGSSTDLSMAECGKKNLWGDDGRAILLLFWTLLTRAIFEETESLLYCPRCHWDDS
jgi:hypothetical protein